MAISTQQREPRRAKRTARRLVRLRGWFRRARSRWYRITAITWITDLAIPALFTVATTGLVWAAGFHLGLIGALALEPLIFFVGFVLTQGLRNLGIRRLLPPVLKMAHAMTQGPHRDFLQDLAIDELRRVGDMVGGLAHGGYKPARPEMMATFFERFFKAGGGTYTGIDSHMPSDYVRSYEWYLRIHALYSPRGDTRVMVATQTELSDDYFEYDKMWSDFVQWHRNNEVELKWIDREKADALRAAYALEKTDVGLWANHAVLFELDADRNATIQMVFREDPDQKKQEQNVVAFVDSVLAQSETVEEGPPGLDVMNPELARSWELYVDPASRLDPDGALAKFLLPVLDEQRYILDAATGIGCESVLLLSEEKHRFSVVSNEVDASLRTVATEFAMQHGCKLDLRRYYWERLATELPGNLKFDAILVMGNSLCLTLQKQRREQAMVNLYSVLKPGGVLVVDERNFQYMLDHRDDITADPYLHFPPVREGDALYRGIKIRAYPQAITDDLVSWRFFQNEPRVVNSAEMRSRPSFGKVMSLHPFRRGELYELLRSSGFKEAAIDMYADLKQVTTLMPGDAVPDPGEATTFLTYVARKPAS